MTANGLIVSAMAILFLIFGYLGVPVAFSLIAGVVIGTLFTPVSLPSIIAQLFNGIVLNPARVMPHRTIRICSTGSSARHLRWRSLSRTSE